MRAELPPAGHWGFLGYLSCAWCGRLVSRLEDTWSKTASDTTCISAFPDCIGMQRLVATQIKKECITQDFTLGWTRLRKTHQPTEWEIKLQREDGGWRVDSSIYFFLTLWKHANKSNNTDVSSILSILCGFVPECILFSITEHSSIILFKYHDWSLYIFNVLVVQIANLWWAYRER